jgi:DNA-directed RNA polymerase subunit RPC12/RpoP
MSKIDSRDLEQKLNELEDLSDHRFTVKVNHNRSLDEIRKDLDEWQPDIFHWSGHGDRDALWLANAGRDAVAVDVKNLALAGVPLGFKPQPFGMESEPFKAPIEAITRLFSKWAPRLVVLDACGSDWSWLSEMLPGVAHQLVARVPAVIAMRYPIDNDAASTFARQLYQGIAEGRPLDQAVQAARNLLAEDKIDRAYGTPVLYLENSLPLCPQLVAGGAEQEEGDRSRHEAKQPFTCGVCGRSVNPGRAFCPGCRTRYQCGACKAVFEPNEVVGMNFCPRCGYRVMDEPGESRPRLEAAVDTSTPPVLASAHDSQLASSGELARAPIGFKGFRVNPSKEPGRELEGR